MSKQVRLRRGTTLQHTTFTGADGEVTFDTTRKCLVVHDGVTPGGRAVTGFLVMDPGNPAMVQVLAYALAITGGDGDTFALEIDNNVWFHGGLTVDGAFGARKMLLITETLAYAGSVNLDFSTYTGKLSALAGNIAFTASNMALGRTAFLRL